MVQNRKTPTKMPQQLFYNIQIMILSLFSIYIYESETAQILSIMPVSSKSHHNYQTRIVNGLLSRGHVITYFNPFDGSDKSTENLTNIIINENQTSYVDSIDVQDKSLRGIYNLWLMRHHHELETCDTILSHPKMKKIIKGKHNPYDLIMFESYALPCYLPLAEKLQLPAINVLAINDLFANSFIGRPNLPSFMPLTTSVFSYEMNFIQRLYNTIGSIAYLVTQFWISNPTCNQLTYEHYGPSFRPVEEMYSRIKLTLYGTHPIMISTPIPPNAVEIGGVHIAEERPLPRDIQKFIDESKEGVIYFSFGSTVKFSSIPTEKLDTLLSAFSEIPQRILLRCDLLNNTNFPSNVMAKNWIPQRDVLAHKNVRAFISHMGVFSTLEAIHTATPLVGIPFIFDQHMNARIAEKIGVAVYLYFDSLTKDDLVKAMNDIIHDKRYFNKMQEISYSFRDRPMSPLDTAIYWIEYVIRHNGASHLRPISADLPLYKYLLLDVLLFVVVASGIFSYILYLIAFKIFSNIFKLFSGNTTKIKKN